jgi:hypothetical protein
LPGVHGPNPDNGLGQRRPHLRVEPVQSGGELSLADTQRVQLDAVETLCRLPDRVHATLAHVSQDRLDDPQGGGDVDGGAGQHTSERRSAQVRIIQVSSAKVQTRQHSASLRCETSLGRCGPTHRPDPPFATVAPTGWLNLAASA